MNSKVGKSAMIAASLAMAAATGQTGAADQRQGGMEAARTVAYSGQALDGRVPSIRYAVQLYPVETGGRVTDVASVLRSAAPAQSGASPAQREELSTANKTLLPEPGNWAMIFAGLLGVCAIARRRMSV